MNIHVRIAIFFVRRFRLISPAEGLCERNERTKAKEWERRRVKEKINVNKYSCEKLCSKMKMEMTFKHTYIANEKGQSETEIKRKKCLN